MKEIQPTVTKSVHLAHPKNSLVHMIKGFIGESQKLIDKIFAPCRDY